MWEADRMSMSCLFLLATIAIFLFLTTRQKRKLPLPPGPPSIPLIGNLVTKGHADHRSLAKLADTYGGLFHLRGLGFSYEVIVSNPDMARQVLNNHDKSFDNRPSNIATNYLTYGLADMTFAEDGPFWRQLRKLCVVKLFSRRHAQSWTSIHDEVDRAVHSAAARAGLPVDIGEISVGLTRNVILRATFGTKLYDRKQEELVGIIREYSELFVTFNIGDLIPCIAWMDLQGRKKRLRSARALLDQFLDKIIDEHIENRKETDAVDADMVDEMLLNCCKESEDVPGRLRLTRNNIKAIIMDLMFGAVETPAVVIEWAISELMKNPHELNKVQQELADVVGLDRKVHDKDLKNLPYLKCAINEVLRLHPPLPITIRKNVEQCHVAGYSIPAGSRVRVNLWAIGRDKSSWTDPNEFRPSRFMPGGEGERINFKGNCFEFIPFGSGRRSCPGMQLGIYVVELAVAQLLHCFEWELPDGMRPSELDMNDVSRVVAPKAVRLAAIPKPRLTCSL